MGYAYYEINRFDSNIPMKRGYAVSCKCHKRGCKNQIDRGVSYLCFNCGWYFCGEHMRNAYCEKHDHRLLADCFVGEGSQMCDKCVVEYEKYADRHGCEEYHE